MNGRTNVTGGGSNGSLGGVIPLEAPSNFTVTPDNGKCLLTWTDPKDKYADEIGEITDEGDQLVSQFAYTRIVRKQGSAPSSPNDGDLVTDSSTRNQYQSSAYVDDGLTNNTLYYYAAFTCNTDGVYSGAAVGSGTPKSYDPILANNTWEQINDVANEGIASSVWNIGDEIDITLTTGETLTCVIAGFNHHQLSDRSGTAAITFSTKHLMNGLYKGYASNSNIAVSQFDQTDAYSYLINTVQNQLPLDIYNYLDLILEYWLEGDFTGYRNEYIEHSYTSRIFFHLGSEYTGENTGSFSDTNLYSKLEYYSTASNRIKRLSNGTGQISNYTLPCIMTDASKNTMIYWMNMSGEIFSVGWGPYGWKETAICFGFCIGKTPS